MFAGVVDVGAAVDELAADVAAGVDVANYAVG